MSSNNDEYVYLISTVTSRLHSFDNKAFHFHTHLSTPLKLEGDWEVALVDLFYPILHKVNGIFFFVYADIVDYSYVGSKQYNILRPIQLRNFDNHYTVNYEAFQNPYYLPVNKQSIDSIEIILETDENHPEDYFFINPGDISLTLHFRKRK